MSGEWVPILGIIFSIGLPIIVFGLIAIGAIKARNAERMAMIAQGVILEEPEKKANRFVALRNGLLLIGVSLGVLLGLLLYETAIISKFAGSLMMCVLPVLFGGLAFIIYFFISRKMQKQEPEA